MDNKGYYIQGSSKYPERVQEILRKYGAKDINLPSCKYDNYLYIITKNNKCVECATINSAFAELIKANPDYLQLNIEDFLEDCNITEYKQEWKTHTKYIIVDMKNRGSCMMDLYKTEQAFGGTACIYSLYVNPEFRGKGIGKRLLSRAENLARKEGHKEVILEWDSEESEVSYKFYLERGYEPSYASFKKILLFNQYS